MLLNFWFSTNDREFSGKAFEEENLIVSGINSKFQKSWKSVWKKHLINQFGKFLTIFSIKISGWHNSKITSIWFMKKQIEIDRKSSKLFLFYRISFLFLFVDFYLQCSFCFILFNPNREATDIYTRFMSAHICFMQQNLF